MNPVNLRPKRDWVSVLDDPRREKLSSGIFLPTRETGVEKVSEGTGIIIRIGPGIKGDILNLKSGDRVLYRGFIKHASKIETDEFWEDGSPKHYFLMSIDDIMAIVDHDLDIGVFSGRPATGEVK